MKTTPLLLAFLLFGVLICKAQQIDSVHQKKAALIIERVASGKPLPAGIKDNSTNAQKVWGRHYYEVFYKTTRVVNEQLTDSVLMNVHINESLMDLEFEEQYYPICDGLTDYHYNIEKGETTYAYNSTLLPDSLQKKPVHMADNSVLYTDNAKHDSTLIINKKDSLWTYDKAELERHKERDRKSFSFYEPKLLKSIDELYDMLFK